MDIYTNKNEFGIQKLTIKYTHKHHYGFLCLVFCGYCGCYKKLDIDNTICQACHNV